MQNSDIIFISSEFLVNEFNYSQNIADGFISSFLFFSPLLLKPAFFIDNSIDIDSAIKISRYRSNNCLTRRCKKPYLLLIEKLEKYKKEKNAKN